MIRTKYPGAVARFPNNPQYLLPTADYGADKDRDTGSSYARLTGHIYIHRPILVSAILWDIRIAHTFICRFVTAPNGTTSEFDVNTSVVVGGAGEITITPTGGDFVLTPGVYFLQLATNDATTHLWSDYDSYQYIGDTVSLAGVYYTTLLFLEYTLPVKIRGCAIQQSGLSRYARL